MYENSIIYEETVVINDPSINNGSWTALRYFKLPYNLFNHTILFEFPLIFALPKDCKPSHIIV